MTAIIDFLNTVFWSYILIYGLLAVGVYFTIRLRFQQILHFGEMSWKCRRFHSLNSHDLEHGLSTKDE